MILKRFYTRSKSFQRKSIFLLIILLLAVSVRMFSQIAWEKIEVPDSIIVQTVVVDSVGTIYIGADGIIHPNTNPFFGIYKSTDYGANWIPSGLKDTSVRTLAISDNGNIYASSMNSIYRSNNGGLNWEFVTNCSLNNILNILTHNNDTIYASGWEGIIRSFNAGHDWDTIVLLNSSEVILDICFDNNDNILFGKTSFSSDGGVFVSNNWGNTWTKKLNQQILSLDVNSDNEIFATTSLNGVFKSSDMGQTWDSIFFGVRDLLSIVINEENKIFIGCEKFMDPLGGVYASYDNGITWVEENSGLTNEKVDMVYLDPPGFLYAVCSQNNPEGKLFRTTQTTVGLKEKEAIPGYLSVYPNPATTNLSIDCSMFHDNESRIDIFDLFGRKVKEIKVHKGKSKVEVVVEGWQRGLYIVRIISESGPGGSAKILVR